MRALMFRRRRTYICVHCGLIFRRYGRRWYCSDGMGPLTRAWIREHFPECAPHLLAG